MLISLKYIPPFTLKEYSISKDPEKIHRNLVYVRPQNTFNILQQIKIVHITFSNYNVKKLELIF